MLDIGFRDDIKEILGRIRGAHQTIFVSATIEGEINRLSRQYMKDPIELNVSQDQMTVDEVDQSYVSAERRDKFRLLRLVLGTENPPVAIVFCNTRAQARKLATKLYAEGIPAKEIHGDLDQNKRDRVMAAFRKHQIKVLVATDLAARGIDVSAISHIINYDIPPDSQVYVHRIGRTARMGARGIAITFVTREEGKELTNIEKLINREIPERQVEGFTPSSPPEDRALAGEAVAVAAKAAELAAAPQAKNLGGKYRPSRRRRRF
jgi:ATP-dependent RNA helicase DeaD